MEKKMMYALVAVVLIIVVVAGIAGAYVLMNSGGGGNSANVANAKSLRYDVDVTYQGTTTLSKFAGKNLNASDIMLRIDMIGGEAGNYTYIFNGGNKTAWQAFNGNWTDISTTYNDLMGTGGIGAKMTVHMDALVNWSGTGDYTYTDSVGTSYRIYNVAINPTLDNSLFQPNT
jgi:hypothetical protein